MSNYEIKIDKYGTKSYHLNGIFHREDGPAVEYVDGYKAWYIHGKRHRESGPAIEYADGSKEWYKNGLCHREDGPAVDWIKGYKFWFLNDKKYGKNDDFTNESWVKFVKTLIFS